MQTRDTLQLIEFTDPVCTWCWGSEAVLRALKLRYGDHIAIKYIMSGLVEDIYDFEDLDNEIGGDPEVSNEEIGIHWLEASVEHGMPVTTDLLELFSDEHPSSYPQNIAYKAAQFEDQELADIYLRKIREATAIEGKQTNRIEVLLALAKKVGLDTEKLLTHFEDGTAQQAFEADLAMTGEYEVELLPTFILRYMGKEMVLENYQSVKDFDNAINQLTDGELTPQEPTVSAEAVLQFIKTYGHVAPKEIMTAFDLQREEAMEIAHILEQKLLATIDIAGNDLLIFAL